MSQDASTNPGLLHPSGRPPTEAEQPRLHSDADSGSEPLGFAVESYADDLMDDLFEEVERFLSGGNPSLVNPIPVEEPPTTPPLPSPPPVVTTSQLVLPSVIQPPLEVQLELPEEDPGVVETLSTPTPTPAATSRQSGRSYDRLLLGLGCISILVTLAIWLVSQQTQQQATVVATADPQPSPINPTIVSNREFAEYMQRSLQTIDQRSTSPAGTILSPTALQPNSALPTVAVPSTPGTPTVPPKPSTSTGRTPTGLERVYVPIYQLPPNLLQRGTPIAPLPGGSSAIRLPSAATPASKPQKPPVSPAAISVPRTLVGVMELGNDSAALVEINGVTQRYRVGESISSSGWTLVEISKNQAIIRRNGEVRSVFIGQNF